REVENFEDHGDIGEIWFGEDSVEKMVDWVVDNMAEKDVKTIDLGCGNGHLLLELNSLGYTHLTGVDYSSPAIDLATKIADEQGKEGIRYMQLDLLDPAAVAAGEHVGAYDLALDKGTFDAISLAEKEGAASGEDGAHPADGCNWTEAEIIARFQEYFAFKGRVSYPTFSFGGVKGQTISTVAFVRL
ncbi:hypothetical protein BDK51DRAFT_23195, partial [Blyttiomyces helicus]